jgi:hypothetical protein
LIENGRQTLEEIEKGTEMNKVDIKHSLIILIHHNLCIFYTLDEIEEKDKKEDDKKKKINDVSNINNNNKNKNKLKFYQILENKILMRYRIGYFINIIQENFSQEVKIFKYLGKFNYSGIIRKW